MSEAYSTHESVMPHAWRSHVLQENASCPTNEWVMSHIWHESRLFRVRTHMHVCGGACARMRYIATQCNTLQHTVHTATHCNTLQHTAPYCNTLHHTATHCNKLQHSATLCNTLYTLQHTAPHCTTLHHTATHCNTLQHTATTVTHCNKGGCERHRAWLQNWYICGTWLVHMCDTSQFGGSVRAAPTCMTHLHVWHDSSIYVMRFSSYIHECDMTHS